MYCENCKTVIKNPLATLIPTCPKCKHRHYSYRKVENDPFEMYDGKGQPLGKHPDFKGKFE